LIPGLILLSLIVSSCDRDALGSNPPDRARASAAAEAVSLSKNAAPVESTNNEAGQVYPDLRTIARVAPKGRIQDKEYNPSIKAVDELVGMGIEAVPFLIQKLDDDKKIDHHVLDFWSDVTVGDVSLVILTDFFTTPSMTEHTIPGTSWPEILDVPTQDADKTAEEEVRAFVYTKGREAIKAKW